MISQKPFTFSSDCAALAQSIKRVISVVSADAAFFIGVYKKTVCVFGLSANAFARLVVPNSTTTSTVGLFGFDPTVLPGLIKGRAVMDFNFTGTECKYKQTKGQYSGKLSTIGVSEDQCEQLEARCSEKVAESIPLSSEEFAAIKAGFSVTGVKDVYQNASLISFIVSTEKGLMVSSFDAQHFAVYRVKKAGRKFRAALPQSHFGVVDQMAGGTDMKFAITSGGLRATGGGFSLGLPATQADDRHYTMVSDFLKNLPKAVYSCELDVAKLQAIADNLFALYNANSNFNLSTKGSTLSLSLSTSSGAASDAIKVKATGADTTAIVEPRLFMDILNLSKACKNVKMSISPQVISFTGTSGEGSLHIACSRAG